jgi:hypothetical protein
MDAFVRDRMQFGVCLQYTNAMAVIGNPVHSLGTAACIHIGQVVCSASSLNSMAPLRRGGKRRMTPFHTLREDDR